MTQEHESLHYLVEIEQQPIELYKLLKIANLVSAGGEAKVVISEGYVFLNEQVEYQKRKKIYSGDIIQFNGDFIEVLCHQEPIVAPKRSKAKTKDKLSKKPIEQSGRRKPINF